MLESDSEKELERLLSCRSLWQRGAESSADVGTGDGPSAPTAQASGHLDADQLNALTYGGLPPATQTLYRTHLADCDSCCALFSEVGRAFDAPATPAQDAPVPSHTHAPARPHKVSALDRLSRFFAWPVLQFAAPALALLLGAVCVYVYVADRPGGNLLAMRREEGPGRPDAAGSNGVPAAVTQEAQRRATAPAPPTPEPSEPEQRPTTRGQSPDAPSDKGPSKAGPPTPEVNGGVGVTVAPPNDNGAPGYSSSRSLSPPQAGLSHVAGHQFRREGSTWVDVNYHKAMTLIRLRRGSDTYLSIVGQRPELRAVAEQMGGEVIVVLGNQAYAIR